METQGDAEATPSIPSSLRGPDAFLVHNPGNLKFKSVAWRIHGEQLVCRRSHLYFSFGFLATAAIGPGLTLAWFGGWAWIDEVLSQLFTGVIMGGFMLGCWWSFVASLIDCRRRVVFDFSDRQVHFYGRLRPQADFKLALEQVKSFQIATRNRVVMSAQTNSKIRYQNHVFKLQLTSGRSIGLFETFSQRQAIEFGTLLSDKLGIPLDPIPPTVDIPPYLTHQTPFLRPAGAHGAHDSAGAVAFESKDGSMVCSVSRRARRVSVLWCAAMGPGLAAIWWSGLIPELNEVLKSGVPPLIAVGVILIGTFGLVLSRFQERRIEFDAKSETVRFFSRCLPPIDTTIGHAGIECILAYQETYLSKDPQTQVSSRMIRSGANLVLSGNVIIPLFRTRGRDDLDRFLAELDAQSCQLLIQLDELK